MTSGEIPPAFGRHAVFALIVESLITHPRRQGIVMIGTLLSGLLFLLPAVDSYQAAGTRLAENSLELENSQEEVSRLDEWKKRGQQQTEALRLLETRVWSEADLDELRSELVEIVHDSQCTMRRVSIGEPRRREWMNENDHPLEDRPPEGASGETPFLLETRPLVLVAEGSLGHVKELLGKLEQTQGLLHPANMTVRNVESGDSGLALELSLVLMNLIEKPQDEL